MIVGVMLAVVLIILLLALTPAIKETVDLNRNSTISSGERGLDCGNSSISDYKKATCIGVDLAMPLFAAFLLGLAGLIIGAKILT